MKLSFAWLNDFADFSSIPMEKILEKIALSICEVDEVEDYMPALDAVQIVQIRTMEKHPDADKLSICRVFNGKQEHIVVTAAKNISIGDVVPLALPGVEINGQVIQAAKLRGVDSYGMFVSQKELQLADDDSGVFILPNDAPLGRSIRSYYQLEDKILHIDNKSITHRPDLWSHFGFARELAAQLKLEIRFDPFTARQNFQQGKTIHVQQNKNAHSYYACLVENIRVENSQEKIRQRLVRVGINTINNVVDVSNYVMLEMGQPTHFFDKDVLGEIAIEVALSQPDEKITLLDDSERVLSEGLPLIRNHGQAIALAGVMGGQTSAVHKNSKTLVLESAVFTRESIRKSIRATGIRSEASIRYEKGLDSSLSLPVLHRSLQLLQENGCPDLVAYTPSGFNNQSAKTVTIHTSLAFINTKLGIELTVEQVVKILEQLHFTVKVNGQKLTIIVAKFRHNYDVTIPEDIVEEVGRTIEYSQIKPRPLRMDIQPPPRDYKRELENLLKIQFAASGFSEIYSYSFVSDADNQFEQKNEPALHIQNPMPDEFSQLKLSPYPSLLKAMNRNEDRFSEISLFEYARSYHRQVEGVGSEQRWLAFSCNGDYSKKPSQPELQQFFLHIRDKILAILTKIGISEYQLSEVTREYLHPHAGLVVHNKAGQEMVEMGLLHPKKQSIYKLKKRTLIGKMNFAFLLEEYRNQIFSFDFTPPSVYPDDQIDISILCPYQQSSTHYAQLVQKAAIPEVEAIWVHDIYRGENLPAEMQSITYRTKLITYNKTFTGERIQQITGQLIEIAKQNGYQLRE